MELLPKLPVPALTFMMLDADIVAVSPASVWRVLGRAGLLRKWNGKSSKKATGFEQPSQPHRHWHIDVSYLMIAAFTGAAVGLMVGHYMDQEISKRCPQCGAIRRITGLVP